MISVPASVPAVTLDARATAVYSHLFQALSDPTRLAVVQHLAGGEHRVRDLVAHMGFAQSTVSKHLSFLLECGLVTVRPAGRSSWYALADPDGLARLFTAARALLCVTGVDAALCTHLTSPGGQPAPPDAATPQATVLPQEAVTPQDGGGPRSAPAPDTAQDEVLPSRAGAH